MLPTLRQLEASALVYRLGSLTEAAAKLCIARCAISLLIRQIEEVAQVRLFDGTTRALRPTPACHEAVNLQSAFSPTQEGSPISCRT
jgi:LysR family transcriptional regulator, carnitine catabolism transcriptional activator